MLEADPTLSPKVSARAILSGVAAYRGVPLHAMTGRRLDQTASWVRFEAYLMLQELAKLSLAEIGRKLGARDHTSIFHGLQRIRTRLKSDPDYADELEALRVFLLEAHHAAEDKETILDRARRVIAMPSTISAGDAMPLALGLVTVAALLRKDGLTEREARLAALAALNQMKGVTQ